MDADEIWEVTCTVCPGMIDMVPAGRAREAGREHLQLVHPVLWASRPADIDDLWTAGPAPLVCDVCYVIVELPYWEHVSTPPTHVGPNGERDESGVWLLCDRCHELHAAGRLGGWTRHAWSSVTVRSPWLLQLPAAEQLDQRARLAETLRLLLARFDAGTLAAL